MLKNFKFNEFYINFHQIMTKKYASTIENIFFLNSKPNRLLRLFHCWSTDVSTTLFLFSVIVLLAYFMD